MHDCGLDIQKLMRSRETMDVRDAWDDLK
jgi:hypothetical protein